MCVKCAIVIGACHGAESGGDAAAEHAGSDARLGQGDVLELTRVGVLDRDHDGLGDTRIGIEIGIGDGDGKRVTWYRGRGDRDTTVGAATDDIIGGTSGRPARASQCIFISHRNGVAGLGVKRAVVVGTGRSTEGCIDRTRKHTSVDAGLSERDVLEFAGIGVLDRDDNRLDHAGIGVEIKIVNRNRQGIAGNGCRIDGHDSVSSGANGI